MLRHTGRLDMRLLCLTMLPDGGALTPALKTLGYKPYSLRSSFQKGHASTHPIEWSQILDRKKTVNKAMFGEYDCFVGPPAALVYDVILRECPSYTKVILVEEPDKARWAAQYDTYLANLRKAMKRTSKNKITVSFNNMLEKMVVRGAESSGTSFEGDCATGEAASTAQGPASVRNYSYAKPAGRTHSSSPLDLERALKAEAEKAKQPPAPPQQERRQHQTPASRSAITEGAGRVDPHYLEEAAMNGTLDEAIANQQQQNASDDVECPTDKKGGPQGAEEEAFPMSARAIALERYEESVKMAIPSSRLLVYRYGDGWEPLCSFLERPVPEEPFPPYDDGLHVLGYLQERIYWAQFIMYVLVAITVTLVLANAWPYLGSMRRFAADMYQDYQLAFGEGEEGSAVRVAKKPAENFEDQWARRGGIVTVESKKSS